MNQNSGKKRKLRTENSTNTNPLANARNATRSEVQTYISGLDTHEYPNKDHKEKDISIDTDRNQVIDFHGNVRSTSSQSKADIKARELWFKKSGVGYSLFVEYYGGQPLGVVVPKNIDTVQTSRMYEPTQSEMHKKQGMGQSRAAKKRRNKKDSSHQKNPLLTAVDNPQENKLIYSIHSATTFNHELLETLREKPHCRHISSYVTALAKPLPLTFRIRHNILSSNQKEIDIVDQEYQSIITKTQKLVNELKGNHSNLLRPLQFDSSIYQALPDVNLTKRSLGNVSSSLKSLILEATSSGLIARQEFGSMLPVLALHGGGFMQYGSKVLDLCASPGSKTLQALEIVASCVSKSNNKPGRVVANDIHPLRLESLQNAIMRSGLPSSQTNRIVYTNYDASKFPTPKSGRLFDCVIADVPCSGDGTVRKDIHIIPGWKPVVGNTLHELQVRILKRALQLVKVGGVVAYSTCSLNPVEDEAVVASILKWANKDHHEGESDKNMETNVELIDWPQKALPGIITVEGTSSWRVADYSDTDSNDDLDGNKNLNWFDSFEQAKENGMITAAHSMWPCGDQSYALHLKKCVRLLPQAYDTGGFFVALLRKNRLLP